MIHKGLAILDQENVGEEGEYSPQYIGRRRVWGRTATVRPGKGLYVLGLSHHVHGGGDAAGHQAHPDPHADPLSKSNRHGLGVRDRGMSKNKTNK